MKAKIDKWGFLFIERAGKWKSQACPFESTNSECSDHCPLFHEQVYYKNHAQGSIGIRLLCGQQYEAMEVVEDERRKPTDKEEEER